MLRRLARSRSLSGFSGLAEDAQSKAAAWGIAIECRTERVHLPFTDPNTKQDYYEQVQCRAKSPCTTDYVFGGKAIMSLSQASVLRQDIQSECAAPVSIPVAPWVQVTAAAPPPPPAAPAAAPTPPPSSPPPAAAPPPGSNTYVPPAAPIDTALPPTSTTPPPPASSTPTAIAPPSSSTVDVTPSLQLPTVITGKVEQAQEWVRSLEVPWYAWLAAGAFVLYLTTERKRR